MADRNGITSPSPQLKLEGRAVQTQKQELRMSQQQIMSLNLLAMGSTDLRQAIYAEAEKNPALEISSDPLVSGASGIKEKTTSSHFSDDTHYGSATAAGSLASDNFEAALESEPDEREPLQDHLEHQFNAMHHTQAEEKLGLRLIHNLDTHGHHILAPVSLLEKNNPEETLALLIKCIAQIQTLDPVGTCCKDVTESLLVQAKYRGDANRAVFFLLDGHLDFLDPPQSAKIIKKVETFVKTQTSLSFLSDKEKATLADISAQPFTEKEIEEALSFIRTLDPYPARDFGTSESHYIAPDVYVTKIPITEEKDDPEHGIIATQGPYCFKVTVARDTIPQLTLSPEYKKLAEKKDIAKNSPAKKDDQKFAVSSLHDAQVFIDSVQFRESTVAKACAAIVKSQQAFFARGPRYLVPLRQKDIAEAVGVHEATISRMASEKYIQCEWGLFEVGYFFTNAVGTNMTAGNSDMQRAQPISAGDLVISGGPASSKEAVKYEISQMLAAQPKDAKPLSDQKIADMLASRGIAIARRTVAKYRSELEINSSYSR